MLYPIEIVEKPQLTPQKNVDFLGDAVEEFLIIKRAQLQPKSLQTYKESLTPFIIYFGSDRETDTITRTDVLYFLNQIDRKPSGVYMIWQTVSFFFRWYYAADPGRNPMNEIHMKRPKRDPIKGIDPDQVEKILKKITGADAIRNRALISVLFASGLRDAEFCGLQQADINGRSGQINVRSANAKGRKWRTVYITGKALLYLNRYLKKISPETPELWQTRNGSALSEAGIRDIIKRCCTEAGLEAYSFHDFRRGCALAIKRKGADIKDISHFLGHADLKTTERYLALDDTDNAATAIKYNPLG